MKSITVDLNIIMDFLFARPGHQNVAEAFTYCNTKKIRMHLCAHELTTLFYFLDKNVNDRKKAVKVIALLLKRFSIIEINKSLLEKALYSGITDFEDAVIDVSSNRKKVDYIITRNKKDFSKGLVKAINPEELLIMAKNP